MYFCIGLLLGIFGTLFVFLIIYDLASAGTIVYDDSDKNKDNFLFVISHLDRLYKRKIVILKVKSQDGNDKSQKKHRL